jgi:hypothetical protein
MSKPTYDIVYNFGYVYLVDLHYFYRNKFYLGQPRLNMYIARNYPNKDAVQYWNSGAVQALILASTNREFISFKTFTNINIL